MGKIQVSFMVESPQLSSSSLSKILVLMFRSRRFSAMFGQWWYADAVMNDNWKEYGALSPFTRPVFTVTDFITEELSENNLAG